MEYTWLDGNYPAGECGVRGYGAKSSKLAELRGACLFSGGCRQSSTKQAARGSQACPGKHASPGKTLGVSETKAQDAGSRRGAQHFPRVTLSREETNGFT